MSRPKLPLADQKMAFNRQKAQAKFRGEGWEFDFDQWWRAWEPLWDRRGMRREDYCMIRPDPSQPWSEQNHLIVTREQYLCIGSEYYWTERTWPLKKQGYDKKVSS